MSRTIHYYIKKWQKLRAGSIIFLMCSEDREIVSPIVVKVEGVLPCVRRCAVPTSRNGAVTLHAGIPTYDDTT